MFRLVLFLFGFGLTTIGFVFIISYLNLLALGYNFLEYVQFIFSRIECLEALIGIAIMWFSINRGGENELYIWYLFEF